MSFQILKVSLEPSLLGKHSLSVTSHINCIVSRCPDQCWLSQGMCLYQVMMTVYFLNDVANDAESTQNLISRS